MVNTPEQLPQSDGGKRTGGIGDVRPRGGGRSRSGESLAKQAAQRALQLAQIDLRDAESIYREGLAIAKRALDSNLTDFDHYLSDRKDLERQHHESILKGFQAERAAATMLPNRADKDLKLRDIEQREADELRRYNEANAQAYAEGARHTLDTRMRFAEIGARLMEERQRTADNDLARFIGQGTKTQEQAVHERFAALSKVASAQGEVLRLSLVKALGGEAEAGRVSEGVSGAISDALKSGGALVDALGGADVAAALGETLSELIDKAVQGADFTGLDALSGEILARAANPEAAREALDAIKAFFYQRQQAFQQNNKDTRDAQAEDLRSWQDYAAGLAAVTESVRDIGFEIAQIQADALGENPLNRRAAIEARRALDAARENARSAREVARLEAEVQRVARDAGEEGTPKQRRAVETVRGLNNQIEAEERLHQARMVDIDRQANEARRQQLVEIGNDLAGILTAGLEQFDGTWSSVWRGMLQEALGVLRQIGAELMRMAFTGQGSNSGGLISWAVNTIGGALLGGLGGGGAAGGGTAGGGVNVGGMSLGPPTLKFAGGGSFEVGGSGGTDSQLVQFWASPDERVTVETPAQQRAGRGGTYIDRRRYVTLNMPPRRAASTYKSRRGTRETAEDLLSFLR